MNVVLKFETIEELEAHLDGSGAPAFAACADAEPKTWVFATTKRKAVFEALHLAPKLALDDDPGDLPVWRVEGLESLEYIEAVPQFVAGELKEAWDKLMHALDELVPAMPVSVFAEGDAPLPDWSKADSMLF